MLGCGEGLIYSCQLGGTAYHGASDSTSEEAQGANGIAVIQWRFDSIHKPYVRLICHAAKAAVQRNRPVD
jgi:hypothetical protein